MTTTVWKAQLEVRDEQEIEVPVGSEMLHVDMQHGVLCIWYRCDPTQPRERRRIRVAGTGHPIPEGAWRYVSTCVAARGHIVWHVFEA